MKYLAGLSELYGTVQGAARALDNLNAISGHVAGVVMNRRMQRMGAMGDFSASAPWDVQALTTNDSSTIDFGQPSTVTNQENNSLGGKNTFYADGSVVITNAAGQDVTQNYIPKSITTPASTASLVGSSISDAVSNVPATIASAASTAVKSVSSVLTPIAVIAVVGLVAYMLYESGKK